MSDPLFCPNPTCPEHWHVHRASIRWFRRAGFYSSRHDPRIQRFRCRTCGRFFSAATFSPHYHAKKHLDLRRLRRLLVNGASTRACARQMFVSPTTISHRVLLLARQSLAFHSELSDAITLKEEFVADGFQSFAVSQYHPNNFNLLAGAESQYLYAMTSATLRRSGSMTPRQRARREKIELRDPPEPRALENAFTELMDEAGRFWWSAAQRFRVLRTDEHRSYPRCLKRAGWHRVRHETTSSRVARTRYNPLFSVNYLDREIRKDLAEHHRETVCFARSQLMSDARMWIYLVWHNTDKPYRISPRQDVSHAEAAGIAEEFVRAGRRRIHTQRAFLTRSWLSHTQRRVWMGMIRTPEAGYCTNRRLTPDWVAA
jgi:transposase-like protein/IS1 family transposase